jgi:hypothetical protein
MSHPRDRRAGVRRRMAREGEHLLRVVGSRRRHTRPPLLRRAPPGPVQSARDAVRASIVQAYRKETRDANQANSAAFSRGSQAATG